MHVIRLCLAVLFCQFAHAIHFYTKPGESKCFYEELPKGAIVVAKLDSQVGVDGKYDENPLLKLDITVDVSIFKEIKETANSVNELT
jgi:hypothetical protein